MTETSVAAASDLHDRLRTAAREAGAELCVLFGSRAAGSPRPGADVDLALVFAALPSPQRRLGILGLLQAAAGAIPVDITFVHAGTDPVLRFEIFRSGCVLHEAQPGLMVEERVRALIQYEDALPLRRIRLERQHLARKG